MKRLRVAAIALAIACVWTGVANATSHGLMPNNLSFWAMIDWQIVHFRMHIDFVYVALLQIFSHSPQTVWQLLIAQTGCAAASPLTAFLFGSPGMALVTFFVTFFVTVFTPIGLLGFALYRAFKSLGRRAAVLLPLVGFTPRLAPA